MKDFSIKELVRYGWETYKRNPGIVIGASVLYIVFSVVVPNVVSSASESFSGGAAAGLGIILYIAAWAVSLVVQIGYTKAFLNLHDGKSARVADLFTQYHLFWKYLGTSILVNLIVAGPIMVVGILGAILSMSAANDVIFSVAMTLSIMLIIPAIYFSIRYGFAMLVTVDRGSGPVEALKQSSAMTVGVKWRILLFWLAMAGLNILGVLALIIGLIVTIPITFIAYLHLYRRLSGDTVEIVSGSSVAREPVIEA